MNAPADAQRIYRIAIALTCGLVALWLATLMRDSAQVGEAFVPMGNDSFYHARRMIDVAEGRGLTQFDDRMHVPEGSWITWPWAYDWLGGQVLSAARLVDAEAQPMAVLGWIPVVWVLVNVALFTALAARARLRIELVACAALAFALSGALQALHGFGIIDHHFIELSFVLASALALMRWLDAPEQSARAATAGAVLGAAVAFHTGAFVLQVPALIALGVVWLRGDMPPSRQARVFAATLVGVTLLVLLPSAPFRDLQFSLTTLSAFHGYVALCTATMTVLMAGKPFDRRRLALVAGCAALLGVPLVGGLLLGGAFLGGELLLFDRISEVRSPIADLFIAGARPGVFSLYSYLILLVPVALVWCLWTLTRRTPPSQIAFAAWALFGLSLMLLQQRLVYFGLAAMVIVSVLMLQQLGTRLPRAGTAVATLIVVAISVQPQLRGQLFADQPAGLRRGYEMSYALFAPLAEACANQPGVVIAGNNDGHPVRYHTDCSVLANNFVLTPQHEGKLAQLAALTSLSPEAFLAQAPEGTRYVLTEIEGLYVFQGGRVGLRDIDTVRRINPALFMALAEARAPITGFELVAEVRFNMAGDPRGLPVAQLYRIEAARR
ncbi:MAG: hypothetical protein AAFS02_11170 [Pseudomonadota bacterium]